MESGETWACASLNRFLGRGPQAWAAAREWLTRVLSDPAYRDAVEPHLHALDAVTLHLPFEVADYVDFYASEHHATNVGALFRPTTRPAGRLEAPAHRLPRPRRHGRRQRHRRRSARAVSAADPTAAHRCSGRAAASTSRPRSGSSSAEPPHSVCRSVSPTPRSHLFGVVLLNDWSARDIQAWEYVPLGPFLGKSFATSISAWVTPMAALDQARVDLPAQDPEPPHDYLRHEAARGLDLHLEVSVNGSVITRPGVPRHLLVARADARAPDGQRCLAARRRPVRVRHGQRDRAGHPRVPARALGERSRPPLTLDDGSARRLPRGR